jgi:exodeoxyribonuclease V gamma subunit
MAMIQEFEYEDQEFFQDPGSKNLLSCIQQDILYLRGNPAPSHHSSAVKKKIKSNDTSVIFQSCHSPMREVEILHDQLLGFFDQFAENDPIEPRDILIMAPDINDYAPLIRAVFDAGNSTDNKLPYSISDQSIKKTSKYIDAFFEILSLLKSRFSSIDVFGLLKTEPVKNRFAINDHELSILENWIDQTRICWGIDQNHKKNIDLPDYSENTWRAGLDRLLLGYATPGDDNVLFENILPYGNIEGNDTELLGKFLDYTENIFAMAEIIPQKHTLAGWSEILLHIKDTYLLADDSSEADDRLLHQSLYGLRDLQTQTSFDTLISIDVIQSYLLDSLEQRYSTIAGGAGFLSGGITFCSMLPMRAVPFKIICILGLNDGLYPRTGRKRSFDLMALEPRRGDRSRRYDDRYLFLETILSARKKLYISFAGQSIQDGSKKTPSVLVSELMDYIEQGYEIENRNDSSDKIINHLTTYHRLQPFHPEYFLPQEMATKEKLFSYSAENCDAAVAFTTEPQSLYPLVTSPLTPLPETYKQVELNDLIRFFTHPVRYFLVMRIGIAFIEESQRLNTSEPFAVKGLERYKLENDILKRLMEGHDYDNLYQAKKAESTLPHGKMGEIHFTQIMSAVQSFKRALDALFSQKEPQNQEFSITINDFEINGRLDNLSEYGMVHYRYAKINPKDMIRSWISHLALNSSNGKPGTVMNTFLAGKDRILKYLPVPESNTYLEQLLSLYWQGLSEPLHFFPRSSFVFAREIHKGKSEQEALLKAKNEWEGNAFHAIAEKNDPYNSLCFKNMDMTDTLFMDQAKKLFLPIFEYQTRHKVF